MKFIASQRGILVFLGITTLIALYVVVRPGTGQAWMLDPLTGFVAAGMGAAACASLVLVNTENESYWHWWILLGLMTLVCVEEFAEPSFAGAPIAFEIDAAGDFLMLAAGPLLLWLTARTEPPPVAARRLFWAAFAAQLAWLAIGQLDIRPASLSWPVATDLVQLFAMQAYLLGAILFVSHLRRQLFVVNRRVCDVGDVARYLFVTSHLFKKQRYPRLGNFVIPGGMLGLGVARFFAWYFQMGPRVHDQFGRGLWRQFVDICAVGFRHGLDPQAYYMFELYRAGPRSRASGFLTRYETKNGLFKVLTWQLPKSGRRTLLGDKLAIQRLCDEHGIPSVPNLITAEAGELKFNCERPAGLERDLFLKPRQLKGARGTEIVRFVDGKFVVGDGAALRHDELLEYIARRSREAAIMVQPRITNHPDLADLAGQSLLALRVITCLGEDGEPVVTHGMLRVLCKLEPNWTTDVELGAPVDLASGVLGLMTGDKPEMALDWYEAHPVTQARVLGRQVPCWHEACSVALAAHAVCKDRLLVGWDIAIGPEGPLLLEGNSYADVDFLQRVHRCSIGDSPLGPLLFARLVDVENRIAAGTLRGGKDYA